MGTVEETVRLVAQVRGHVQGVGFRFYVQSCAKDLELEGQVWNAPEGYVDVVAEGARDRCVALLAALDTSTAPGRVDAVEKRFEPPTGEFDGFVTG